MTHSIVTLLERDRVAGVEPVHALRQRVLGQLNEQMKVIGHERVGVQDPLEARHAFPEEMEKELAVAVVHEYALFRITARHDVEEGPGILKPKWSSHSATEATSVAPQISEVLLGVENRRSKV